eukprot:UN29299
MIWLNLGDKHNKTVREFGTLRSNRTELNPYDIFLERATNREVEVHFTESAKCMIDKSRRKIVHCWGSEHGGGFMPDKIKNNVCRGVLELYSNKGCFAALTI